MPKNADTRPRVTRRPLPEQVANSIRDMILQNELEPGQRVREREISERLNVSRTPLREAFMVLATEGLIELLPNKGAIIAKPNKEEIADMLRLLGVLEGLAGELACERADDAEIAEIKALHYEMLAAFARDDLMAYFKLNQRIHLGLVAASRSTALVNTHKTVNARLYWVRFQPNRLRERWPEAVSEHNEIIEALEARDAAHLSELLRNHLGSTWDKIQIMLPNSEQD